MQLIYSENGAVVAGLSGHYRNPDYFEKVDITAESVMLVGDFPMVEQAYKQAGITVEHYQATQKSDDDLSKMTVPQLKELATAQGLEFDENIKKSDLLTLLNQPNHES